MPYNFESQKKSARNLVLSPNSQLTVAEVMADANLTRRQRFDGSAVLEQASTRRSDKDMSGKGTEFATDGTLVGWDTKFNFKSEADDWVLAWALAFAMGKDVVAGSGPYVHTINFDETTTQAKLTNVYLEDTSAVHTKYSDMAVSDVTLSFAQRGSIGLEVSMVGTGKWTDGSMGTVPALPSNNYLLNSDVVCSLGPVGSLASFVGRFMSGTLKISNAVMSHTAPGGGLYGVMMRTGLRKFSLDATIAAQATDDIRTLLINDTLSGITIVGTSGTSVISITIPSFKLKANKIATDGNMVVWQISLDETTAFYASGNEPLTVAVTNGVATAYMVGA